MLTPWFPRRADFAIAGFVDAGRYRVDIGVPLTPEPGGGGLALRFSVADRTAVAWAEPQDLARARSGMGRASLMRW